ncbi:hypothetical protein K7432_012231 [Basidiobolus ranarum]|uniref:Uncharacterized protein n=1 Tax=Basidiobolus ranarum TaxID=34480 RepID=A0ABR2VSL7_9FUNG
MIERIDPELIEEAEQSASRYYHETPADSEIRKSPLGKSGTPCQVDDGRSDIKSVTDTNNPVGALTPAGTPPSGSNVETLMKEVGNEETTSPSLLPSPLPSTVPDRVSLSPEPSKEQNISDEKMDEDIQCKQVIWDPSTLVLLEKHIIEKTEEFNVEELDELRVKLYNILKMNLHHSDRNLVIKNMLNEIDLTVAQIGLLDSEEISQFY